MAFQEIASLDTDTTIQLGGVNRKTGKKNPSQVEGYFLGSKKVESKKAKSGYAYLHILLTDKGNVGVWGKTDLDRKILTAPTGTMVRLTHTGMQQTPNGDMYKYKVEVDSDNKIAVEPQLSKGDSNSSYGSATQSHVSNEYNDQDESNEDQEEQDDSDEDTYTPPPKAAAEDAIARAAKVKALLNKNRTT